MFHSSFTSKRWRNIILRLPLLLKELTIILRWLIFGTFASLGRLSEFLVSPLVLASSVLRSAVPVSTTPVLSGASINAFLDFEVSCDFRLYLVVSLGRLPNKALIVGVLLDLIYSLFDNDWTSKLTNLPFIIAALSQLVHSVIIMALCLWLQFRSFVCI